MLDSDKLQQHFHVLVIGNFSADNQATYSQTKTIDRDNFEAIFAELNPVVNNILTPPDGATLSLSLAEYDDLHADAISERLELTSLALRASRALSADTPDTSTTDTNSSFNMDDVLSATPTTHMTQALTWEQRIKELGKKYRIEPDSPAEKQRKKLQLSLHCDLLQDVLKHSTLKSLEQNWLGLYDLVHNTETNAKVKIQLHNLPTEQLNSESFSKLIEATSATIAVFAEPIQNSATAAQHHIQLNQVATQQQCHLLAQIDSDAFVESELTSDAFAQSSEWHLSNNEINKPTYLYPSIVARLPYGKNGTSSEINGFSETLPIAPTRYTNPAFRLCAILAQSYNQNPVSIVEIKQVKLDELPAVVGQDEFGDSALYPSVRCSLSESSIANLTSLAISPVVNIKNEAAAYITNLNFY